MVYNGSGTGGIVGLMVGVNELTEGMFSTFLLLLVFGIVYYMQGSEPTREAFTSATFVTFFVAALGRFLTYQGTSFVNDYQLGVCFVAFMGALVMLWNRD